MKNLRFIILAVTALITASCADAPEPYGAIPSEHQLAWHKLERYVFIHFTVNTFTGREWGFGSEPESTYNPTNLDPAQWVEVAKAGGFKGIVLTTKHHDGFCLWPSEFTEHSVKNSPCPRDVVKEVSDACREQGLKFGVYLSPWDRNMADYGYDAYVDYYHNQLNELTTKYGEIFEVWFDGANGGEGYYGGANEARKIDSRTYYKWPETYGIVRKNQPQACMFSDCGPDIRWVGNERGFAPATNWCTLNDAEFVPGDSKLDLLGNGQPGGVDWTPAEVDVSIRPGWFYHEEQDDQVRSVENLIDIYYSSVGSNANWILNIPPDKSGRIHPIDSARMVAFSAALAKEFPRALMADASKITSTSCRGGKFAASNILSSKDGYWAAKDEDKEASLTITFKSPVTFDRILLQEHIALGQRVNAFSVEALVNGEWKTLDEQTTIGYKRILRVAETTADAVRVNIKALACPTISNIELYNSEN